MAVTITFPECKGIYRHAWFDAPPPIDYPFRVRAFELITLRCIRCDAERYDAYDETGWRFGRKYKHPDGYRQRLKDKPSHEDLCLIIITKKRRAATHGKQRARSNQAPRTASIG